MSKNLDRNRIYPFLLRGSRAKDTNVIAHLCQEQKCDLILYIGHIKQNNKGESAILLSDGPLFATSLAKYRGMIGNPIVFIIGCEDGTFKKSIARALFPDAKVGFGSYFSEVPPAAVAVLEMLFSLIINGLSSGRAYQNIYDFALDKGVVLLHEGFPNFQLVKPFIPELVIEESIRSTYEEFSEEFKANQFLIRSMNSGSVKQLINLATDKQSADQKRQAAMIALANGVEIDNLEINVLKALQECGSDTTDPLADLANICVEMIKYRRTLTWEGEGEKNE